MKVAAPEIQSEIKRRKTFGIISHPDAGKTTITEKLLLFGNAIHMAGMVKAKRAKHFATSDWMEIEKQRGISTSSSVMQFTYKEHELNLLDTPGHQDFSEDTYRVLTAVDSAMMVLDSSKGIETQTKKLFQVCRERQLPIITFMNKVDLEGRDPFDLIDEVEKELQLPCFTVTWPIGQGSRFKGVYDILNKQVCLFEARQSTLNFEKKFFTDLADPELAKAIGQELLDKLIEDLELLEGAGHEFDQEKFLAGELTPVYFGSAINNFGVQELLEAFLRYAPSPRSRPAKTREVEPIESPFTGVIFKIQANMDPKHRDRCAFLRVCSGKFEPGMTVYHVRQQRDMKLNNAVQFMSQDRKNVGEAYAGDIIGLHDRGNFMIGDTLTQGESLEFTGVPQFSPELFYRVELKNPLKVKQLNKGLEQLAEEGTSQLFRRKQNADLYLGLVGALQMEVAKFRLLQEYGAEAHFHNLPYTVSRWYHGKPDDMEKAWTMYQQQIVFDVREHPMMLFKNEWEVNFVQEKYPSLTFYSSLINYEQECL